MRRTYVHPPEKQYAKLVRLSQRTKLSRSELVRKAVDQSDIGSEAMPDWKEAILSAAGIWKDQPEVEEEIMEARKSLGRHIFKPRK